MLSFFFFFFFFFFRFFFSLWREKEIWPRCSSGCYSGRGVPGDAVNSNTYMPTSYRYIPSRLCRFSTGIAGQAAGTLAAAGTGESCSKNILTSALL